MLKVCEWCGENFNGRKDARYCKNPHYKKCENCGKDFLIKEMKRPAKTCCKKCADALTLKNKPKIEKVCQLCGKKFIAHKNTDKVCGDIHQQKCVVCGTVFTPSVQAGVQRIAKTCSKKCAAKITDFDARNKKSQETNLKKYGVSNPSQSQKVKEKKKTTVFKNYGVTNIFQLPIIKEKAYKNNGHTISNINKIWQKKIKEKLNLEFEFEIPFSNYSADLGYENILIDINPSATHNSTLSFPHLTGRCEIENCQKLSHQPKNKNYHQIRALEAEKTGKILLQYFDWFDPEIFLNIVESKLHLNPNKIYARKCEIREISQTTANKFFEKNHLIGKSTGQKICLGLFADGELVHCQTYGPSRMSTKFEWEAIRSCSKLNYHVQGGFSKCDNYFFKKVNPNSVVSYVDLSVSQGQTESMFSGWSLQNVNKPSAMWVRTTNDFDKPLFIKDNTARRISADRLLGFEIGEKYPRFDKNGNKITNDYVFLNEGYVKIYDAGTKTFAYRK